MRSVAENYLSLGKNDTFQRLSRCEEQDTCRYRATILQGKGNKTGIKSFMMTIPMSSLIISHQVYIAQENSPPCALNMTYLYGYQEILHILSHHNNKTSE